MKLSYAIAFIFLTAITVARAVYANDQKVPDITSEPPTKTLPIHQTSTTEGDEEAWGVESIYRSQFIYPSNWGTAGIFRVRSAESLPDGALTFGIGGEFYSTTDIPPNLAIASGSNQASTIAEQLFVGYAPTKQLTLAIMRRNSSTTYGNPQTLISSLGDVNFSGMYSFPVSESFAVAPIVDFLVASDFNQINPDGNTLSLGVGAAASFSFYPATGLPLFVHGNAIYHMPQLNSGGPATIAPETFYGFSRYNTVTLALGGEIKIGDFIPFIEMYQTVEAGSSLSWNNMPSQATVGARFTPLENKSLSLLLGADVGLGRTDQPGVPYTPPYQIVGQLSYTVGVSQTERKHYFTTKDVNVVDRKFIIKKAIIFKVASAELDPSSTNLLKQIAEVIKQNKVKKLLIAGHTDSTANEDYNAKLSQDRANSVKRFLVGQGIPEDTFIAQGYGKRKPRASNLTEEGRALNRRVEFFILE